MEGYATKEEALALRDRVLAVSNAEHVVASGWHRAADGCLARVRLSSHEEHERLLAQFAGEPVEFYLVAMEET